MTALGTLLYGGIGDLIWFGWDPKPQTLTHPFADILSPTKVEPKSKTWNHQLKRTINFNYLKRKAKR